MVHCYTIDETINKFSIGYMINHSLKFNNSFKTQVWKLLSVSFSVSTIKTIKNFQMKNNTCVIALIMIYENNGEIPKILYRVLNFVVYYLI